MVDLSKLSRDTKFFFLAYDQGMCHDPVDLNTQTTDLYIRLLVELNGKTHFLNDKPYSYQVCVGEEAMRLHAKAVGCTIYVGSRHEAKMFKEFANIAYEAHNANLPVVGWIYPSESHVGAKTPDVTTYVARVWFELGADILKVKYMWSIESMKWVVQYAGSVPVCVAGGNKVENDLFVDKIQSAIQAGCMGDAVGRNIWQDQNQQERAKEASQYIFS